MEPTPQEPRNTEDKKQEVQKSPVKSEASSKNSRKSSASKNESRRSSRSKKESVKKSVSSRRSKSDREDSREQKDFRTLYVSNLKKDILDVQLEKFFAAKGEVERVKVLREPQDNMCRGYGFITFKNSADAQKALDDLKDTDFEGQTINIEISKRSQPRPKTPGIYRGRSKDGRDRGDRGDRRSHYDSRSSGFDRRRGGDRRDDRYRSNRYDDRRGGDRRGGDRRRDDRRGGDRRGGDRRRDDRRGGDRRDDRRRDDRRDDRRSGDRNGYRQDRSRHRDNDRDYKHRKSANYNRSNQTIFIHYIQTSNGFFQNSFQIPVIQIKLFIHFLQFFQYKLTKQKLLSTCPFNFVIHFVMDQQTKIYF